MPVREAGTLDVAPAMQGHADKWAYVGQPERDDGRFAGMVFGLLEVVQGQAEREDAGGVEEGNPSMIWI